MGQKRFNPRHITIIAVVASITVLVMVPSVSFGEEFTVVILKGSSTKGCETTDSCLSPSTITIHKGDSVRWVAEEDVHHPIRGENYKGEMSFFTMDYSNTFYNIGTISYHVLDMPWIRGTVIVDYTNQKLGNHIDFDFAEKVGNQIFLTYSGHVDTDGAAIRVFDSTGRLVKKFGPNVDDDGFFSETFQFREFENYSTFKWVEGIYDVKLYIGDEEKNERVLVQTTDFYLEISPHGKTTHTVRILDGSMENRCDGRCVEPETTYIQRGDSVEFAHNDCEGCHHMRILANEYERNLGLEYSPYPYLSDRWWTEETRTFTDIKHPWITGKIVVGSKPADVTSKPASNSPAAAKVPEIKQEPELDIASNVPDWVRNVFLWYGQEQIREDELLDAIKYLINEKILVVD